MGRPPEGLGDCQRRIRKPAHLQDAFSRSGRIVTGAELGRAYMQLAQPDGWVVRINRHGAMITQKERKAYRGAFGSEVSFSSSCERGEPDGRRLIGVADRPVCVRTLLQGPTRTHRQTIAAEVFMNHAGYACCRRSWYVARMALMVSCRGRVPSTTISAKRRTIEISLT